MGPKKLGHPVRDVVNSVQVLCFCVMYIFPFCIKELPCAFKMIVCCTMYFTTALYNSYEFQKIFTMDAGYIVTLLADKSFK